MGPDGAQWMSESVDEATPVRATSSIVLEHAAYGSSCGDVDLRRPREGYRSDQDDLNPAVHVESGGVALGYLVCKLP
jgi:hypothetical protein